ncbi:hypothetical protein [Pseudorhizobium flavum]|uniref:hypothetical protein n=1 Tax=Pseudorhizobium flavum TaxID=1335061 RepID=UPI00376FE815
MFYETLPIKCNPDPLTVAGLAASLNEDPVAVQLLLGTATKYDLLISPEDVKGLIPLSIMQVLWRRANVQPAIGAALLQAYPEITSSLEEVLFFRADEFGEEEDPFLFFRSTSPESIPVPATDDYIDVVQDRFFIWRRPKHDRHALGCSLLPEKSDLPLEAYLDALATLRRLPTYEPKWLGRMDGHQFVLNHNAEPQRAELHGSLTSFTEAGVSFEDSYSFKISINITLAARDVKRRTLGLAVVA